jgi:23S rRNA pseudouridine955/2504/2580 synthase
MQKDFIINDDFINARLDRWLRKNIGNVPQAFIEKNIRKGKIKINKKRKKCSYKLQKNDVISLYDYKFEIDKNKKVKTSYIPNKKELSFSSKIFVEDNENFAVINKPAGISVQQGTKSKRNIIDILKATNEFKDYFPYSVHRIDKETTGLLIVAKNRSYAQLFTSLFRIRKIHKTYLGIIIGIPEKNKGTFKDDLLYFEGKKQITNSAITHYKVLDSAKNFSLILLNPETGRKHQLRKQLLMHGHPILGDDKYRMTKKISKNKSFLMLHAYKINFSIDKVKYNFIAEPPLAFNDSLKQKYLKIS